MACTQTAGLALSSNGTWVPCNKRFFAAAAVKRPRDERAETPFVTTDGAFHAVMALASSLVTQNDRGRWNATSLRQHAEVDALDQVVGATKRVEIGDVVLSHDGEHFVLDQGRHHGSAVDEAGVRLGEYRAR